MEDRNQEGDDNSPNRNQMDEVDVSIQFENTDIIDVSHEFIRRYIRHIDQKASILLTILVAILGVFGNALRVGQLVLEPWEVVWGGAAVFCAVLSLTLATWAVYPKANKPDESEEGSYIYWENILLFPDAEKMIEDIEELSPEESLQQMAGDLYIIAAIARNKYDNLRRAMVLTFLSAFFATPAIIYRSIKEANQFTSIEPGHTALTYTEVISIVATLVLWSVILLTIVKSEEKNRIQWVDNIKKQFDK
jgi:hypothetical protein